MSSHWVQIAWRLGRATGAEVPALAGECEQVFVCTLVAADAREPVVEHAAGEELVGDLCDDGAPWAKLAGKALVVDRLQAVQMIRHQPKKRRRLGASRLGNAMRRRCRVGHARSGTGERRAYVRFGRRAAPFRCARGRFDATSARRRPHNACCRWADRSRTALALCWSARGRSWRYTAQQTTSFFQVVAPHTARRPSAFDIRVDGPRAHSSLRRA